MKRTSGSTLLVFTMAVLSSTASAESRRSFVGVPAFLQRKPQSSTTTQTDNDGLYRTDNALCAPTTSSSQRQTANCEPQEPSDRKIRYAVQRGEEITASRTAEYAYLQLHGEEFPVIPASNARMVPTGRWPLDSDLYHV